MNKKLIGLALFLTLAVTLGACNEAATDAGDTQDASPSPTVSPADAPSPSPS